MGTDKPSVKPPWTDEETTNLLRGMTQILLSSRPSLYTNPKLQHVSEHGGDRINQKLKQLLKELAKAHGVEGIVNEELDKLKGARGGKGSASPEKKGVKQKGAEDSPTKKRKVKAESLEELE